jgi:hypothetical protein
MKSEGKVPLPWGYSPHLKKGWRVAKTNEKTLLRFACGIFCIFPLIPQRHIYKYHITSTRSVNEIDNWMILTSKKRGCSNDNIELVMKIISLMKTIYQHIGGVDPSKTIREQIEDFIELQEGSVNIEESRRIQMHNVRLLLDMKKLSTICNHFGDRYLR